MAGKKRTKALARRRRRRFIIFLEVLCMLLLLAGGYVWGKVSRINKVATKEDEIEINAEVIASSQDLTGVTNIALFGLDSRTGLLDSGVNADTMIVASINSEAQKIHMVSLYRDTYMNVGGGEYTKANAAYSYGGPEQALSMMNMSMDLQLEKYIAVDFAALAKTIDLLGGLDIELTPEEAHWTDGYVWETARVIGEDPEKYLLNDWEGGYYHLNGIQATSFCRIRYTAGDDFKRTERQRMVIQLMFDKAKTMDLTTLNSIADQVFPMIQTNMSLTELITIGSAILQYGFGESIGMPIEKDTGRVYDLGDCVIPTDWANDVSTMHATIFGETGYIPTQNVRDMASRMASVDYISSDDFYGYSDDDFDVDYSEDSDSSDTGGEEAGGEDSGEDYSEDYEEESYSDEGDALYSEEE